jgi:hypothetical protein
MKHVEENLYEKLTIDLLITIAIKYGFIPRIGAIGIGGYNFQMEILKSIHELGLQTWLKENNKKSDEYTLDNFFQYLASEKDKASQLKANIESGAKEISEIYDADTANPQPLQIPDTILQALQQAGFIENAAAKPLKWTAEKNEGKRTGQINKISLLDLLCILDYSDSVIRDKKLLKKTFSIEFKANNYTNITDTSGKLKRPIISEYHKLLSNIVETSKQK